LRRRVSEENSRMLDFSSLRFTSSLVSLAKNLGSAFLLA
jgi:hypothetical protein